jgi:uncharacterized protein (TIGR02145 family)
MKSISTIIFLSFFANFISQNFQTVKIGSQQWTQKNSEIDEFRNGEKINEVKTKEDWLKVANLKEPAWCYYEFDSKNAYLGKLYNYYAISDKRNIAPNGWKTPSFFDFFSLIKSIDPLCTEKYFEKNGSLSGGSLKI